MEYLAFALKYRPKNFDEVVGQRHVVLALQNAILKKHLHHAYLFSGPRGTGKTSLARIFAKSLNCFEGPTVRPCEKCVSCSEINRASSMDVIEIDGASNRGIDEIRALRENIKLVPTYSRYKIYIIDEVHMLSQDAFAALLKTLEEPPQHVKFIFATTHIHKVLPTILSRCQKFQFSLLSIEEIVEKLKRIIKNENINIQENILYTIAKIADGSIRDAESLLDQIVPVISSNLTSEDIFGYLGIISEEIANQTIKYIVEHNLVSLLEYIDSLVKSGKDLGLFLNAIVEHLRSLLLLKISPKSFDSLISLSPATKTYIKNLAGSISISEILNILDLLIEAKDLSTRLLTMRIPLELAFIKYMYKEDDNLKKLKNSQHNNELINTLIDKKQNLSPESFEAELEKSLNEEKDFLEKEEVKLEESIKEKDDNLILTEVKVKWQEIILYIQKTRAALASHLAFGRPISSCGNIVKIGFTKENCFHKEVVENNKNLQFINEAISKILNKKIRINFILSEDATISNISNFSSKSQTNTEPKEETKQNNEFINDILDAFGGSIDIENVD
ncbi:MAG: DNA polymerase III subunit gamma/tau [Candidatus Omnitrophica bacterium]|nr:DNA polymerase III subunit gamma/tau [Candidatus Omnitrophota bacterium]